MLTKGTLISGETLPSDTDHAQNSTKSAISGLDDLLGDGFVVWAQWTKDPEDNAQFTGEYSSGSTDLVFGQNGTKVYYPDWNYSPRRFWHRGSYVFAAALPASFFNASHAKTDAEKVGNAFTGTYADNVLTLDFGKDNDGNAKVFDLSATQDDLMFTTSHVDNCGENASEIASGVSLQFQNHNFTQIVIEAASMDENADIIVDELVFSGNHKSIIGPMTVTFGEEGTSLDYTIDPSSITNPANPYRAIEDIDVRLQKSTFDGEGNRKLTYEPIVTGLLVLPEETPMTLDIKYRTSLAATPEITSEQIHGTVSTAAPVTWEAGRKYVYRVQISSRRVDIVSTSIMGWNEQSINHEFN